MLVPATNECPYRGLQPYSEADRELFFGRERDSELICANLLATPLTVLIGDSGVGKSSVLLAGAAPQLRAMGRVVVVVYREWQPGDARPPVKRAILEEVNRRAESPLEIDLKLPLDELLLRCEQHLKGEVLLVFDQFEEYCIYNEPSTSPDSFDAEFARAVNRRDVHTNFLVSIRQDGLSRLDRFQSRIPHLLGNLLRLESLTGKAAKDAIEKPIEHYNQHVAGDSPVTVEPGVAAAILEEVSVHKIRQKWTTMTKTADRVADGRVDTSFLQLVLTRLWNGMLDGKKRTLSVTLLRDLGGAEQIVYRHIDDVMNRSLNTEERAEAVKLFRFLVTPSGSKFAHSAEDLSEFTEVPLERTRAILSKLATQQARILRTVVTPETSGKDTTRYEIFHDVLGERIQYWCQRFMAEREAEQRSARKRGALGVAAVATCVVLGFAFSWQLKKQREIADNRTAQVEAASRAVEHEKLNLEADRTNREHRDRQQNLAEKLSDLASTYKESVKSSSLLPADRRPTLAERKHFDEFSALLALESAKRAHTPQTDALVRDLLQPPERVSFRHAASVRTIAFSPDGRWLATGDWADRVHLWNAATGQQVRSMEEEGRLRSVLFTGDNRYLATASKDIYATVYAVPTGEKVARLRHKTRVWGITTSPDGRYLATGSGGERFARLWQLEGMSEIPLPVANEYHVRPVALDRNALHVAAGTWDGDKSRLLLWDRNAGRMLVEQSCRGNVTSVAFSADDKLLLSSDRAGDVHVVEVASGRVIGTVHHDLDVLEVAPAPDPRMFATASRDGTVGVWRIEAAATVSRIARFTHGSVVNSVAWSPDSIFVLTGSWDHTARVWELNGETEVAELNHRDGVLDVVFSPDGKYVATASNDGLARREIWQSKDLIEAGCARLSENFTLTEWKHLFENQPYQKTCESLPVPKVDHAAPEVQPPKSEQQAHLSGGKVDALYDD